MILYMNFYTLFSNLLHLSNIKMVIPGIFLLTLLSLMIYKGDITLKRDSVASCGFWILFLVYQIVCIKLKEDNGLLMFRQTMYFLIWFNLAQLKKWHNKVINLLSSVCFINTIATFVFLVIPSLYKIMIKIYGRSVSGTSGGRTGYRAALADHYSQNAVFISMAVLSIGCILLILLFNSKKEKPKFVRYGALFLLSVVALLLTSKRGPLLFCGVALVAVYFISEKKHLIKKIVIFCIICATAVACFYLLARYIPELTYTIERFTNSGQDESTKERMQMWKLAKKMFKENPLFGNGTYSYRLEYSNYFGNRFQSLGNEDYQKFLNTHNVFLQVLAENGIVGFLLFLLAYLQMLFGSIRTYLVVREVENDYRICATQLFSVAVQIYFLFYCITGNPMYDIFYAYYCCGIAINLVLLQQYGVFMQMGRKKRAAISKVMSAIGREG